MVTKTLTITKEAYDSLKREKLPGESFSETVIKLTSSKGKLSDYAGAWKDMTDTEENDMWKKINKLDASWGNDLHRF